MTADGNVVIGGRLLALLVTQERLRRLRIAYRADSRLYAELVSLSALVLGYADVTKVAVTTAPRNDWIMTTEAAQRLGVKPAAVRRMLREGRLSGTRPGTVWLVDAADVAKAGGMLTPAERDQITVIQRRLSRRHAQIDDRPDLNPAGKRARKAREQIAAEKAHRQILETSDANHAQASRDAYYKTFGLKATGSTDVLAHRDAVAYADKLDNPADALRELTRADLRGDTSLATAIAERAWSERGATDLGGQWEHVLRAYADANPARNKNLGALAGLDESPADRLADSMYRHLARPADLKGADLQAVAASAGGTQAGQ